MSTPLVSVVMPVRNEEKYVAAAIASVLTQSCQDTEVIIADGRSGDATCEVVGRIAERERRVRLVDNPTGTIPAALNIGLRAARGRYVARVDAHAQISGDYLARGVQELEDDPGVAAVGGRRVGVAETATGRAVASALSSPFGVGNSVNHYGTERQDTDHASFGIYRTEVLRAVAGWDEQLMVNEDVDIDHRILALGHRIRYDPEMLILWQVRETVRQLARQYRRYGRGKAAMVLKNGPDAVRARHLAAPALVLGLGTSAVLGLTGHPRAAAGMAAPYLAGIGAATVHTLRRRTETAGDLNALALPGAFAAMHLGWGLGFIEGFALRLEPAQSSAPPPRGT